jgi:hypothetical protein
VKRTSPPVRFYKITLKRGIYSYTPSSSFSIHHIEYLYKKWDVSPFNIKKNFVLCSTAISAAIFSG